MHTGDHRNIVIWQKAMDFVVAVYSITQAFPLEERFALTSQMRRAAVSIPSNIAEGRRRGTQKDFKHFLNMAFGSAAELDTQLELAMRLEFALKDDIEKLRVKLDEIMRMLNKMIHVLKSSDGS